MIAPNGSIVTPSHPRIRETRRLARAASSNGVTTVGPETMTMAPNMIAAERDMPRNSQARKAAPANVMGMPRSRRRRTTRWL
jgi:hypothetical protein